MKIIVNAMENMLTKVRTEECLSCESVIEFTLADVQVRRKKSWNVFFIGYTWLYIYTWVCPVCGQRHYMWCDLSLYEREWLKERFLKELEAQQSSAPHVG